MWFQKEAFVFDVGMKIRAEHLFRKSGKMVELQKEAFVFKVRKKIWTLQQEAEPGEKFSGVKIIKLWDNSVFLFSSGVKIVYFFFIEVKA